MSTPTRRRSSTWKGGRLSHRAPTSTKRGQWWESLASDPDANYDDEIEIDAATIEPTVTWGINPGQSVGISERIPTPSSVPPEEKASVAEALEFMSFRGGMPIAGTKIDVAFIGSCTNGRISDLREAARLVKGHHVAKHVQALVVPGSQAVRKIAEQEGLDKIFTRSRVRMARRRVLDVPRDESRPAAGAADLRLFL